MGLSSDPKFRQDPGAIARQLRPELYAAVHSSFRGVPRRRTLGLPLNGNRCRRLV
jgi:hypothetical protein